MQTLVNSFKSGHLQMFFEISALKNFANFPNYKKTPVLEFLFHKFAGLQSWSKTNVTPKKLPLYFNRPLFPQFNVAE